MSDVLQDTMGSGSASQLERAMRRGAIFLGILVVSAVCAVLVLAVMLIIVWAWLRLGISVKIFPPY